MNNGWSGGGTGGQEEVGRGGELREVERKGRFGVRAEEGMVTQATRLHRMAGKE